MGRLTERRTDCKRHAECRTNIRRQTLGSLVPVLWGMQSRTWRSPRTSINRPEREVVVVVSTSQSTSNSVTDTSETRRGRGDDSVGTNTAGYIAPQYIRLPSVREIPTESA